METPEWFYLPNNILGGSYFLLWYSQFYGLVLITACLLFYEQLFASEEDESDLSDNFVVKTCQKFIPVTSNIL